MRARAIETGSYILAPAQGGRHEDKRGTWGHSLVVEPWGAVIARLDHDDPGVLLADLDPEWHLIGPLQSNKCREAAMDFACSRDTPVPTAALGGAGVVTRSE